MRKMYILPWLFALVFWGCNANQNGQDETQKAEETQEILDDGHSSEIALDWDGVYRGIIPCASCSGILTTVTLNSDKTFEQYQMYLDEKGTQAHQQGTFAFTKDGNKIVLTPKDDSESMYAVGESGLIMLDQDGKESASGLPYVLNKLDRQAISFSEEPVMGLLVLGHEVASFSPCGSSKDYWVINSENTNLEQQYRDIVGNDAEPYTAVLAELVVVDKGKAKDGFAESYESVLEVKAVKKIAPLTVDNYCAR